jgi:hypothetical protein
MKLNLNIKFMNILSAFNHEDVRITGAEVVNTSVMTKDEPEQEEEDLE